MKIGDVYYEKNTVTKLSHRNNTVSETLVERVDAIPQKWIPVSERLPESNGYYLVSGGKKIWICELLNIMGIKGWSNDAKNPIVEAWLPYPLPEPYKSESEDK